MVEILKGLPVTEKIYKDLKERIEGKIKEGKQPPKLVVVTEGNDPASATYVKNKLKKAESIGMIAEQVFFKYNEDLTPEENQLKLNTLLKNLDMDNSVDGIILQLPIDKRLDDYRAMAWGVTPQKDVDGFGVENTGNLSLGKEGHISCTPLGIMKLLDFYNIPVEGKDVVIINRSNIVGKPLFQLMLEANATVTVCHSRTKSIKAHTSRADIVITAVGIPNFITPDMLKKGATIIDVSINRNEEGKLCGDASFEDIIEQVEDVKITPVPGSCGLLTVASLLSNTVSSWEKKLL